LLCALLLLAGLAGCAGAKPGDDFAALLDGTLALDSITEAQKSAFIEEGEKHGFVVAFDDGLSISDKNGGVLLRQTKGGVAPDEPGGQLVVGSGWPDNEFTRQIPNPGIEFIKAAWHMENSFTVELKGMDEAAAKAYAKQLKRAGFDGDVYIECGYEVTFQTENEAGDAVKFFWSEEKGAASHPSVVVFRGRKDSRFVVAFFWANGSAKLRVSDIHPATYSPLPRFLRLFGACAALLAGAYIIVRLTKKFRKKPEQNMQTPPGTYAEPHRYI